MKTLSLAIFLLVAAAGFGQAADAAAQFDKAVALSDAGQATASHLAYQEALRICHREDTLYSYILYGDIALLKELERNLRESLKYDSALTYNREILRLFDLGEPYFNDNFNAVKYWSVKNTIVCFFGLGQLDSAASYRRTMYAAAKDHKLPDGLDQYFNFSFRKINGRNVWGYEWFEELPEDRFSRSFSKIVYYVYSTKEDGSDKDQLYMLHVLMFHNIDPANKIDYILTRRFDTPEGQESQSLYQYTYQKDINYRKLEADIAEEVKTSPKAAASSVRRKR